MRAKFTLDPPFGGEFPPILFWQGKQIAVQDSSPTHIVVDLPDAATVGAFPLALSAILGVGAVPSAEETKKIVELSDEEIELEMENLVGQAVYDLRLAQQVPEPRLEINLADPAVDTLVPIGRKIWDSIFRKRTPVISLPQWLKTTEADMYVYLPNDMSKQGNETEDYVSNGLYTEVMVNAYKALCNQEGINPEVRLYNGEIVRCKSLRPSSGSQPTVPGEIAGRLANSVLVDFDDSAYAKAFIQCICDLTPNLFEKEPVRKRVLAKVEHILMGRTSHTYNQRFMHALYDYLVNGETTAEWGKDRRNVVEHTVGILQQMTIEGLVLEDSKQVFLHRATAQGIGRYLHDLDALYEEIRGR